MCLSVAEMQGGRGEACVFAKIRIAAIQTNRSPICGREFASRIRLTDPLPCAGRRSVPDASVEVAQYSVAGSFVSVRSVVLRTLKPQPLEEAGPDLPRSDFALQVPLHIGRPRKPPHTFARAYFFTAKPCGPSAPWRPQWRPAYRRCACAGQGWRSRRPSFSSSACRPEAPGWSPCLPTCRSFPCR